jgi:prepilin-type N-terminal cleavage/methylation domain-containing protein
MAARTITARRASLRRRLHADGADAGFTLVEMLVAMATLMILFVITTNVLTTYLNAGTTVTSTYTSLDQFLPSQMVVARLIRSEVEPAPTPSTAASGCAAVGVPCPAFLTGSVGTYSVTFYANVGDPNGPSKIVMAASAPSRCTGCKYSVSTFTVTQYPACPALATATSTCPVNSGCPFSATSTLTCSWSSAGKQVVNIGDVVNGAELSSVNTTAPYSTYAAIPIFTYNTLDPYSTNYLPNAGTPANASTGILSGFNSCSAPTVNASNVPTASNCPADTIQSIGLDLEVQAPGSPLEENAYTVYRLSSSSFLYSTLVG